MPNQTNAKLSAMIVKMKVKKRFCIAIPHVQRSQDYISRTLDSLFRGGIPQGMLVVVCDFGPEPSTDLMGVAERFSGQIQAGALLLERFDDEPPRLTGLPRNFGDNEIRVLWRSKQAWDAAWLMRRCLDLADYHLHLEDDVVAGEGYLMAIEAFISSRPDEWFSIKLSPLGATSILIRGSHLGKLAAFLKLFYEEMPLDWLIDEFIALKGRFGLPSHATSGYFEHIGAQSTLAGQIRPIAAVEVRQADKP